jgi:hypothetical protein
MPRIDWKFKQSSRRVEIGFGVKGRLGHALPPRVDLAWRENNQHANVAARILRANGRALSTPHG